MSTDYRFPQISDELIKALEKRFPNQMPDSNLSLEEIRFKQGAVSVVKFLRVQFDLQNKNILEN